MFFKSDRFMSNPRDDITDGNRHTEQQDDQRDDAHDPVAIYDHREIKINEQYQDQDQPKFLNHTPPS